VADAIEVDVNRSFNGLKAISPQNLNNILKSYAVVNHQLDYCKHELHCWLPVLGVCEALAFAVMKH